VSYVDSNLLSGETVSYRTRLHWRLYVPAVLVDLLIMTPIAVVLVMRQLALWAVLPLAVGTGLFAAAHLRRGSSEFAVTNKRVVIKLGVMSTRSLELLLSKVEGIEVNQSLWGKMLGYGDIIVTGSGGTRESFSNIQDPLGFRRAIQEATDARDRSVNG
jgi:uncharacterized membrane protein YdbT with pleckstrin-like domain